MQMQPFCKSAAWDAAVDTGSSLIGLLGLVKRKAPGGMRPALRKVAPGAVACFIMPIIFLRFALPTGLLLLKPWE